MKLSNTFTLEDEAFERAQDVALATGNVVPDGCGSWAPEAQFFCAFMAAVLMRDRHGNGDLVVANSND